MDQNQLINQHDVEDQNGTSRLFDNSKARRFDEPRYVTDVVLAKLLSVSVMTIRKWRAQGRLPHRKFGRAIRYEVDEVVEAISKKGNCVNEK